MIDLALDPSETRTGTQAPQRRTAGRPWLRIALLGALGAAGTAAFATTASTYLSGLAGPQRAPSIVMSRRAADWPDLKDGLPSLATEGLPSVSKVHEILPSEPAPPPVVEARVEPNLLRGASALPDAAVATKPATDVASTASRKSEAQAIAARALPAIVEALVIGPAREATLVAPTRTTPVIAPLPAETVRAKTDAAVKIESVTSGSPKPGDATYAVLPPEPAKGVATKPSPSRGDTIKAETVRAKPRIEAHAKLQSAGKPAVAGSPTAVRPVAERPPARAPMAVEAKAAPIEPRAQDEDTEVFGIKVPSLAPAGRKIRESVEALGEAVKGIPDRF